MRYELIDPSPIRHERVRWWHVVIFLLACASGGISVGSLEGRRGMAQAHFKRKEPKWGHRDLEK